MRIRLDCIAPLAWHSQHEDELAFLVRAANCFPYPVLEPVDPGYPRRILTSHIVTDQKPIAGGNWPFEKCMTA